MVSKSAPNDIVDDAIDTDNLFISTAQHHTKRQPDDVNNPHDNDRHDNGRRPNANTSNTASGTTSTPATAPSTDTASVTTSAPAQINTSTTRLSSLLPTISRTESAIVISSSANTASVDTSATATISSSTNAASVDSNASIMITNSSFAPSPSPSTAPASTTSSNSIVGGATQTTVAPVNTTPTSTFPSASSTSSESGSGSSKGFFQNTGAVAGTFTAVGLILLVFLVFLATLLIRRRRRLHVKFNHDVFGRTIEGANASVIGFLDEKHEDELDTDSKDIEYDLADVGAGYGAEPAQVYGDRAEVDAHYPYIQPQQDSGYVSNPATTTRYPAYPDSLASISTSSSILCTYDTSTPSAARHSASQEGHEREQEKGHEYYRDLLRAAVWCTEAHSNAGTSASLSAGAGAGTGPSASGLSLIHGDERYVFPNPYAALQMEHPPQAQRGGAAGSDDVYGGYIDEHERAH